MQNDPHTPDTGIISRLPKPSLRQRRVIAMGTAAAVPGRRAARYRLDEHHAALPPG